MSLREVDRMNGVLEDRLVKAAAARHLDPGRGLTLPYDKVVYLRENVPQHRRLIHRRIEVAEYPDGRIQLWADGTALPCRVFDPGDAIRQGDIVEHKRLGHVLDIALPPSSPAQKRWRIPICVTNWFLPPDAGIEKTCA